MTAPSLRIAGDSHVGKVRQANEDAMVLEPELGLYVVLDGMGGASAGEVASQLAGETLRAFVAAQREALAPRELLEAAIQAASAAVHDDAKRHRERHGMGTTVVACLLVDPAAPPGHAAPSGGLGDARHAIIAHVGDSRAYLWREGRLQVLTRDHTVVEELVDRGLLAADEAERHPYKNVLSRNLGSKPETRVDSLELELRPGDRVMLCSDGLYGYAATEAIQYLLGSGDAPEHVARDLIELALRGGGGDNVTALVIEAPAVAPSATQVVRTTGALAWWQRRQRFLQAAHDAGLTANPIVRGLPPHEALELVALSLCQAIYHDLEKSTGVNVWTFAQSLAAGWFERGGDWRAVRVLVDILADAARVVVDEIRAGDARLGSLLEVAVSRAMIVIELALGGLLAERLRQVDAELVELSNVGMDATEHTTQEVLAASDLMEVRDRTSSLIDPAAIARARAGSVAERVSGPIDGRGSPSAGSAAEWQRGVVDRPTLPFLRLDRPVTNPGASADVLEGIAHTITLARGKLPPRAELIAQILVALEAVASDSGGNFAAAVLSARELYGVRSVDNAGVMPLYDAFDRARILVAAAVQELRRAPAVRARVLRALSTAHQRLVGATTGLVLEAAGPYSERLREIQATTVALRDAVAKAERQRAALERKFATIVDPSLPWGARGNTEW